MVHQASPFIQPNFTQIPHVWQAWQATSNNRTGHRSPSPNESRIPAMPSDQRSGAEAWRHRGLTSWHVQLFYAYVFTLVNSPSTDLSKENKKKTPTVPKRDGQDVWHEIMDLSVCSHHFFSEAGFARLLCRLSHGVGLDRGDPAMKSERKHWIT